MFLLAVAVLTRRDDVSLRRSPSSNERYHVIHRQELRCEVRAAVVAEPDRAPPLPPLATAKLARSRPLATDVLVVHRDEAARGFDRWICHGSKAIRASG